MPSILATKIAEREEFLKKYRRVYLRSVGAEMGMTDLLDIALRESAALVEFAQDMIAAQHRADAARKLARE